MRPFLYRLTLAAFVCLTVPVPTQAGVWGQDAPEPSAKKSAKELAAEQEAEQNSVYFIGAIAAIVALLVVVQFLREVRTSAPPSRLLIYHSGAGMSHDGLGSRDGGSSYGGLGRSADGLGDSKDDYPDRYVSDF